MFLNTSEAATDLLDKKGAIYSDKPALVMVGELYVSFLHSHSYESSDRDVKMWM